MLTSSGPPELDLRPPFFLALNIMEGHIHYSMTKPIFEGLGSYFMTVWETTMSAGKSIIGIR